MPSAVAQVTTPSAPLRHNGSRELLMTRSDAYQISGHDAMPSTRVRTVPSVHEAATSGAGRVHSFYVRCSPHVLWAE